MKTVFLTLLLALPLAAQTSETNDRLEKALERFPAADADGDGVLTLAEARAFQKKRAAERDQGERKPDTAKAPDGGEQHIYKTVGDTRLPLYVYSPPNREEGTRSPAMVFFFGGGWRSGSPGQFEHQCKHLAERGMVAITVEYRVSSRHPVKVEDCIEDAKSAMRWVRANADKLGVDPDRIGSAGGSAGGHLAACTAIMEDFNAATDNQEVSARPNAMVLFNPALAIAPDKRMPKEVIERFKQQDQQRSRGPAKKVSPLTYASTKQDPCLMFFGTEDRLLKGAEFYRDDSVKAGNKCRIVTYEGQGHGFFNHGRGDGKYYRETLAEMDRFLVKLGWLPTPEKKSGPPPKK